MKFNQLRLLLEKFIRFDKWNDETIELDVNEPLSSLEPDVRGMIDSKGDLYTLRIPQERKNLTFMFPIHFDIFKIVSNNKHLVSSIFYTNYYAAFKDYIFVTRVETSSDFILGESHKTSELMQIQKDPKKMKFFNETKKKFEKKNPDKILKFEKAVFKR